MNISLKKITYLGNGEQKVLWTSSNAKFCRNLQTQNFVEIFGQKYCENLVT